MGKDEGILCPKCESDRTQVKDSRPAALGVRRKRSCSSCGHRFVTMEAVDILATCKKPKFQLGELVQDTASNPIFGGRVVGHFETASGHGCTIQHGSGIVQSQYDKKLKAWNNGSGYDRVIWTDAMLEKLQEVRSSGGSYLDCAHIIGVSTDTIAKKCHQLGIGGKLNNGRIPASQVFQEVERLVTQRTTNAR